MKKFLLGVLIGFLFSGLALVIFCFAMLRLASRPPSVPDASILVFKLEGSVPETPGVEIPLPLFERMSSPTVRDHWELLRKAAADRRIRAVVFMPRGVEAGWGKLQELREDLLAFKKSGKPLYACLRAPGTREYYLATAADRVFMTPEDLLDLKGLRAELTYFKETLDKLGVRIEVEHAGKYKDAPDMFTRSSMSPETREVINSILDDLYGQLTGAIATARRKTPEQIRATIDQGPFVSQQALAAGLVDALQYQDQVFEELRERLKLPAIRKVSHRDYLKIPPQSVGVESGRRVAFVVAEGDIVRGDDGGFAADGALSPAAMADMLHRVGDDRGIQGVIVRIDSPGGDAFASDEIWREMTLLSKKKPLVISMSDAAASGGYDIAMTGDPLIAYPGSFTGSIGVFYGKADLRGLYNKLGVRKDILSRGRFAEIDSDYTPLSDAARQKLRREIDVLYSSFVRRVAQGRKREVAQIEPIAQGRVWLGSQAKANGLIDDFGGIDRAIELLKQKAGIPRDEQVRLVPYPPQRTIWDQLLGRPADPLTGAPLLAFLRRFATRTWLQGGMLKLMPCSIEVK
ncbi:MAG: signal peptide peptidase SppA [Bryobacteraceae bacterium]